MDSTGQPQENHVNGPKVLQRCPERWQGDRVTAAWEMTRSSLGVYKDQKKGRKEPSEYIHKLLRVLTVMNSTVSAVRLPRLKPGFATPWLHGLGQVTYLCLNPLCKWRRCWYVPHKVDVKYPLGHSKFQQMFVSCYYYYYYYFLPIFIFKIIYLCIFVGNR